MYEDLLPVHPTTGLTALGVLDSGRVVWPVLGAAPDPKDDPEDPKDDPADDPVDDHDPKDPKDDPEDPEDDPDDPEDKPLGPKGEKALQAEKARRREETRKRREAEAELAKLRNGGGTEADKAKREAEQAATAKADQRIIRAEVKAAAAGKLADPKDALRFLDLSKFEVDEHGDPDEDEIAEAIDDLITRKPYLAATAQGGKRRFEGGADGGARKGAPKPITEEQLKKMTPAEIDKAYADGRLKHLM